MDSEPADETSIPESLGIRIVWVEGETPVLFGNQFLIQEIQGTFVLTIGQMTPPALLGTPAQRYEQAKSIPYVPVKPVGTYSMNRQGLEELIGVLRSSMANYDREQREAKEAE